MKIRYKLIISIVVTVLLAAVPLAMYIMIEVQNQTLKKTIDISKSNLKVISKIVVKGYLDSGGDFDFTQATASDLIDVYEDNFNSGLVSIQIISAMKGKTNRKILAVLNNNKLNKKGKKIYNIKDKEIINQNEYDNVLKLSQTKNQYRDANCPGTENEKCFEFSNIATTLDEHKQVQNIAIARMFVSKKVVLAPIRTIRNIILISLFLAIIGALFVGYFISRIITKPIHLVADGVEAYAAGNLDATVELRSKDEMGSLAKTFNKMAGDIKEKIDEIEDHKINLEKKVEQRTAELKETLDKVQELKEKQDGDYFLTSLLQKPLNSNEAKTDVLDVQMNINQKKKFKFKKWNAELGGDICISDTIRLKDREYTVIINADAMGKSIQGAGGAIVLGSVFQSILLRTKASQEAQNIFPEKWIKNTFVELHEIFESFDGSMLMSIVLGLIDNKTGTLYHINAEHPSTAVYRNKKAEFLPNYEIYFKLGTPLKKGNIAVDVFQLKKDDILYMGSDGRDDLILEENEDGRVINEDEELFLSNIEETDGDLQKLLIKTEEIGELMDDFSLLRVEYNQETEKSYSVEIVDKLKEAKSYFSSNVDKAKSLLEEIIEEDSENQEAYKGLLKYYISQKDYNNVLKISEILSDLDPSSDETLYIISVAAEKTNDINKAIDFGERLRIRDPDNMKNLIHLIKVYLKINRERAFYIYQKANLVEDIPEKYQQKLELYKNEFMDLM